MKLREGLLAAPFALFLLLPLVAMLATTNPGELARQLGRPEALAALGVSLRTTSAFLVALVVFGTPLAWALARRPALTTIAELPAVLPPSVAGIALLLAFGRAGVIGRALPFDVTFTPAAVVLAQLFVASPFFLSAAAAGFSSVDPSVVEAARLDGAGGWRLGLRVVWPLARFGYVGGLCLALARALGEFGATLLFAGSFAGSTQTVPLAIYDAFETDLEAAKAQGVLLLALAAAILVAAKLVLRGGSALAAAPGPARVRNYG